MIEKVRDDIGAAVESARGIPAYLLLLLLVGSPTGAALITGNVTTEALRQDLAEEIRERKEFEAECLSERRKLTDKLTGMQLDQQRQQITLEGVQARTGELLAKVATYQDSMTDLVRDIAARMPNHQHRAPAP